MPGRKLPGKLEQLERASASLLHNSRAAAEGCGGRLPAPAGPPNPGRRALRAEARHLEGALRDPGVGGPNPRPPGPAPTAPAPASRARCSGRAPLNGVFGHRCGVRLPRAGSPGTLRPQLESRLPRAPWRPHAGSSAGHVGPSPQAGGPRPRERDPGGGWRQVRPRCPRRGALRVLRVRGFMGVGDTWGALAP